MLSILLGLVATLSTALAAAQPAPTSDEARIEDALLQVADAWQGGDPTALYARADLALDLIAASHCPVRDDAALVAFMAGVAGLLLGGDPGFHFWQSARVNSLLNAPLPSDIAQIVTSMQTMPGTNRRLDVEFLSSPYFNSDEALVACAEPFLQSSILNSQPASSERAVVFLEIERRRPVPRQRARYVFSYPDAVTPSLTARIEAVPGRWVVGPQAPTVRALVFDPCTQIIDQGQYHHVCLGD